MPSLSLQEAEAHSSKGSLVYWVNSRTDRATQRNPISKNQKQKIVLRGQSSACQMAEVRRQCNCLQEMATLPLLRNQNKICDNFKSSDQGPLKPWVCNCHRFLSCPMKNKLDFQCLNWNFPVWSLWSKRWGQQEVTCMHMQRPPQKRRGRIPAEWTKASTKQLRPSQQQSSDWPEATPSQICKQEYAGAFSIVLFMWYQCLQGIFVTKYYHKVKRKLLGGPFVLLFPLLSA